MAKTTLYVLNSKRYGSPNLKDIYLRGQSFEVEEAEAVEMLKTTVRGKGGQDLPILARATDPAVAQFLKAAEADEKVSAKKPAAKARQRRSKADA